MSPDEQVPRLNARHSHDAEAYGRLRQTWLNERRAAYVLAWLAPLPAGSRVLEIGSGTGNLLLDLAARRPDLHLVGVEPLPNYVALARRGAAESGAQGVRFVEGTGERLEDLDLGRVDAVLSNDTLHHVEDVPRVAGRLAAVARPGAGWLAIEPSVANPYVAVRHALEPGERNFFPGRFAAEAAGAGWSLRQRRHLFLIPPQLRRPPAWLRAVERRFETVPGLAGGVAVHLERDPA